jgi:hypothetical protein
MSDAEEKLQQEGSEPATPLPPATFEWLTLSLRLQAEMHLGLLAAGDEQERPKPNFQAARHTIDLMAMLQEKTRGNLTLEEQRLLDNSVTELRFRYVQALEASRKQPG